MTSAAPEPTADWGASLPEIVARTVQRLETDDATDLEDEVASHPGLAQKLREELMAIHAGLRALGVATSVQPLLPPRLGAYRILWRIGRGGEGASVFRAVQEATQQTVALKVLPRHADSRQVQRFLLQQQFAALHHPNIVPVLDAGEVDGFHFLAMALMPGGTVAAVLRALRHRSPDALQRLPPPVLQRLELHPDRIPVSPAERIGGEAYVHWTASIARHVAEALQAAHGGGLIHRDVKPSNILLAADGAPRLADFGLARSAAGSDLTRTGETPGTRPYMSPEQVEGSGALDHRTDLYSLGATLYEMLTLRLPLEASDDGLSDADLVDRIRFVRPTDPRRHNPAVPADLATLVGKLLEKTPGDRVQTAAEVATELQRFLDGKPMSVRPIGWPTRLLRTARRHRQTARLIGAATLLTALAGAWAAHAYQQRLRIQADAQDRVRLDARAALLMSRNALAEADYAAAEATASTATKEALTLLGLLDDPTEIIARLCDLAELALIRKDGVGARRLAERLGDDLQHVPPDSEFRRHMLDVCGRVWLATDPMRAPALLRAKAALLPSPAREHHSRMAQLVEHLAPTTDIILPGVIDVASPWSTAPVPYVSRTGEIGLWRWQRGGQDRQAQAQLQPRLVALLQQTEYPTLYAQRTQAQGQTQLQWHCVLFVKDRLLRFAVPEDPAAAVEVRVAGQGIVSDRTLQASLLVLDAEADGRPRRVYVAVKSDSLPDQCGDYEVDFSTGAAQQTRSQVVGSATCVLPITGESNVLVVGLGEWRGFGAAFLSRTQDQWELPALQRIGYVSSLQPLPSPTLGDERYLVGKGSVWRAGSVCSPFDQPEWPAGLYVARLLRLPTFQLDPVASDTGFDQRQHWEIATLPSVKATPEGDRVLVALCSTQEGDQCVARLYDLNEDSRLSKPPSVTLTPVLQMRNSLPTHLGLLVRDLDGDADDEIFPARVSWSTEQHQPVLRVMGMR